MLLLTRLAVLLLGVAADDGKHGGAGRTRLDQRVAVQSAREATDSLRRTRTLMASELQRGDATLGQLDAQASLSHHPFSTHVALPFSPTRHFDSFYSI